MCYSLVILVQEKNTYNSLILPASYPDKIDFDDNSFETSHEQNIASVTSFDKSERDNIKGLSRGVVFLLKEKVD